jgi:hypothetical protein
MFLARMVKNVKKKQNSALRRYNGTYVGGEWL